MEKKVFGQSAADKERALELRKLNETLENLRQKNAELDPLETPQTRPLPTK